MRTLLCILAMATGCAKRESADPPPAMTKVTETSACERLPHDDSVCAHACDPAAVEAAIPRGTCAVFDCPLTDGSVYRIGGCHK